MTLLSKILKQCQRITVTKSGMVSAPLSMLALTEEVGELAAAVKIHMGHAYKEQDKDAVIEEAADTVICVMDVLFQCHPDITEEEIAKVVDAKLDKWFTKYCKPEQGIAVYRGTDISPPREYGDEFDPAWIEDTTGRGQ